MACAADTHTLADPEEEAVAAWRNLSPNGRSAIMDLMQAFVEAEREPEREPGLQARLNALWASNPADVAAALRQTLDEWRAVTVAAP